MYDPGRQSSGSNKMHPGAQLSRRERAAMEPDKLAEHGGAPPIAMLRPSSCPGDRRPSSIPPRVSPPAVVPTVPRRDTASNPGPPRAPLGRVAAPSSRRRRRRRRAERRGRAGACRGADAEAELRWLRTERDALRAQVAHWRDASERHERALAERDTHTRQRRQARPVGRRLLRRLGLDARTGRSRGARSRWWRRCASAETRGEGRSGGVRRRRPRAREASTGASPARHRVPIPSRARPRMRIWQRRRWARSRRWCRDSRRLDDGEPGPHRWGPRAGAHEALHRGAL